MPVDETIDPIAFMKDLDRRFREAFGLDDRRDYSIFYSRLQPARLIVIGIKPGGARDGTHQLASQSFYEDWSHEYVDMHYRIAAVMRPALMHALGASSADELRGVPKTNTFFHRAIGTDDFTASEMRKHVQACAPFLGEILAFVQPEFIILEGSAARENFVRHQCHDVQEVVDERIVGWRRGALNCFFRKDIAYMPALGRKVTLLTLGHPSHFGHLPAWNEVVSALAHNLGPNYRPNCGDRHSAGRSSLAATTLSVEMSGRAPSRSKRARTAETDPRIFAPASRPPANFRYSPIHDFWRELVDAGPMTVAMMFNHLDRIGWHRPSGKLLTHEVVRTDLVSMVKNGFAKVTYPAT